MQLRPEHLEARLKKEPAYVWLIAGDEPFQQMECADRIRQWARQEQGFAERLVFSSDGGGVDWNGVYNEGRAMSLFGDRRIIEVRLGDKRPDKAASAILVELCAEISSDTLLLITCSRLDRRRDMKSKWVQAVDRAGALIEVWPVQTERLPGWIQTRLKSRGLSATADAVELLTQRSEGNLLACAQEIDKLALLCPEGEVTPAHVQQAVGNSSRFTPFDLADALAEGDASRCLRVLDTLVAEGVELPVILWALAREIRAMCAMAEGLDPGVRMPPQRLRTLQARARKLGLPTLQRAQSLAARADQAIKGMSRDNPRDLITALLLRLCRHPLPEIMEVGS